MTSKLDKVFKMNFLNALFFYFTGCDVSYAQLETEVLYADVR